MTEVLDRTTLKALSTDTRQDIIKFLAKRPYTASELSKLLNKHVTTVTEHLNVLEKSGLIRKKDSTNKWIYYTLSDKGEKLFKPNYYSWVVVLSLSAVLMLSGFIRLFKTDGGLATDTMMQKSAQGLMTDTTSEMIAPNAVSEAVAQIPSAAALPVDFIAFALVAISLIGFGYVGYRMMKIRSNILK